MKRSFLVLVAAAAVLAAVAAPTGASAAGNGIGAAYTITNDPAGNAVAVFTRSSDGSLAPASAQEPGSNPRGRW